MPDNTNKIKRRVFLVDDHPMVREHLTALLERQPDLQVCGEAADGAAALTLIPQCRPDLVILDLSLKVSHGLELLKELKALQPALPVLILSMHDETLFAERALEAGALGYITKAEATVNILAAVRMVLEHRSYISEVIVGRLTRKIIQSLTQQELEIFKMAGGGFSAEQIARLMLMDIAVAEAHQASIRNKLRVLNCSPLFPYAAEKLAAGSLYSPEIAGGPLSAKLP